MQQEETHTLENPETPGTCDCTSLHVLPTDQQFLHGSLSADRDGYRTAVDHVRCHDVDPLLDTADELHKPENERGSDQTERDSAHKTDKAQPTKTFTGYLAKMTRRSQCKVLGIPTKSSQTKA